MNLSQSSLSSSALPEIGSVQAEDGGPPSRAIKERVPRLVESLNEIAQGPIL